MADRVWKKYWPAHKVAALSAAGAVIASFLCMAVAVAPMNYLLKFWFIGASIGMAAAAVVCAVAAVVVYVTEY